MMLQRTVKTTQSSAHFTQRVAGFSAVLVIVFYLVIGTALAGAGDRLCTKTARAARDACTDDAEADYAIALGKCNNLSSASDREACQQQAKRDLRDAQGECSDQFDARREICAAVGEAAYDPVIDPANFVEGITNPLFPMTPGTTFVYRGGGEDVRVTVTDRTKVILGVKCVVVRDVVTASGQVVEDTEDFFAQDVQGNVWYFGEIVQDFENGELVSLAGSFKAGVNGAKPGIIMRATPRVGDVYRQEFLLAEAEDVAEVLSLTASAMVPAASCTNDCLITKETTPLEPGVVENKYYARGVGFILQVDPETGERLELIEVIRK
ncbi:MAG TPA: hypothetical protein VK747_14260 [Blastocatellia bacterium]|nr:hypothetical protein [Blastocatellia bacterium]